MKLEKKLMGLENEIMIQVKDECNVILGEYETKKNDMISKFELTMLDSIYSKIQKEKKNIQREKNSRILAVSYTNKQKISLKREELLNGIFSDVNDKVNSFINSDDYVKFLFSIVDKCIDLFESELVQVIINTTDQKYQQILKDYNPKIADVAISTENIIGGLIFKGTKTKKVFDNSLKSIIAFERNDFLKSNNLSFEVAKWQ